MIRMTEDQAHVVLDALEELRSLIDRGLKPWIGYDGGEDDPKLTEQGYRHLVIRTKVDLEQGLSEGRFPVSDESGGYSAAERAKIDLHHAPVPESAFGDDVADNCTVCGLAVSPDGKTHGVTDS